jgi:hypothetical protein
MFSIQLFTPLKKKIPFSLPASYFLTFYIIYQPHLQNCL